MDYAMIYNYYSDYYLIMEEIFEYGIDIDKDIDKVLCDINTRNPVRLKDYTPDVLVKNGIKNLPIYENPAHIRKNILTKQEALKLGLKISNRDNYHGLGKELYIKAINSLDNPRTIFINNNSNNYLIITMIKDKQNNNIVIPAETEATTNINNKKIDINRIKTVYGFDNSRGYDLNDYIKKNLNENKFKRIYEQKKERGTGFSTAASSLINMNIPQVNINVNRDISNNSNM